jgi:nucleoside-diphosphate-sugar epimerase
VATPVDAPTLAVTGASGFVGRHLVQRLERTQRLAIAISRRGTGTGTDAAAVRHVRMESFHAALPLQAALEGADAVIHLAARAHQEAAGGADEERLFREANVDGALHVADAAVAAGVRRFVFVSSIGVNGQRTDGLPFSDADPARPTEPYAISKWQAERALAQRLSGTRTELVVLRPPLVYGAGCPGNFARLVRMAARARWIPLGGVRAPRTFIAIDNLVDALLVASEHPAAAGGTFVLGDARDVSVAEILTTLAAVFRPGRRVVLDVPPAALAALAHLTGQAERWEKLAAPLQVDASGFRRATGWRAATDPTLALRATATQWSSVP